MQRTDEPLLPEGARRIAAWCAVVLLVVGVAAVLIWLCVNLRTAVTPVLLALLGSALLGPVHRGLVRTGFNSSLAAGLTCAALVAVVGGAGYIIVNALLDTGDQIVASLQRAAVRVQDHFRITGAHGVDDAVSDLRNLLGKYGASAASGLLTGLSLLGTLAATSVLALLLTFFFLRDGGRVRASLHSLAPGQAGDTLEAMARRAFEAVEGFMRGTTFIALIDAVCITVGLLVLRVPGAIGLGALVFVGSYIPYLGAVVSGALAVLVALADRGPVIALWVLGVVLAVQQLEGHILQPVIQSRTVQMHPAMILVSLTAGASMAGLLGMLLAVPVAAAAFGVLSELRKRYAPHGPEPKET